MCLATMAYVYVQLPSSTVQFTELHTLTLAACFYALLIMICSKARVLLMGSCILTKFVF